MVHLTLPDNPEVPVVLKMAVGHLNDKHSQQHTDLRMRLSLALLRHEVTNRSDWESAQQARAFRGADLQMRAPAGALDPLSIFDSAEMQMKDSHMKVFARHTSTHEH